MLLLPLLAACDLVTYDPSGEPPLADAEIFAPTFTLTFGDETPPDTLALPRQAHLKINLGTTPLRMRLRAYIGDRLIGEAEGFSFLIKTGEVSTGLHEMRVEADVFATSLDYETVELGRVPVFVDHRQPEISQRTVSFESETVRLNWQDNGSLLLTTFDLYRTSTSGGQTVTLNLGRFEGIRLTEWRDSSYVGGSGYYMLHTSNANGSAHYRFDFAASPFNTELVQEGDKAVLAWEVPQGIRAGAFVIEAMGADQRFHERARVDASQRRWEIPPTFGPTPQYRVRVEPEAAQCALDRCDARLGIQQSGAWSGPRVGASVLGGEVYAYNPVHDLYYVLSNQTLRVFKGPDYATNLAQRHWVAHMAVAPDGRLFVNHGYALTELNPRTMQVVGSYDLKPVIGTSALNTFSAARDGKLEFWVESAPWPSLFLFDFDTQTVVHQQYAHEIIYAAGSFQVSPDARTTWSGGYLFFRPEQTGRFEYVARIPDARRPHVALALDQNRIYFTDESKLTEVDARSGQVVQERSLPASLTLPVIDPVTGHLGGMIGGTFKVYRLTDLAELHAVELSWPPLPAQAATMKDQRPYVLLNGVLFQTQSAQAPLCLPLP